MFSYTGGRNLYGSLTNDTQTANLTLGDTLINDSIRAVLSLRPFASSEVTEDVDTVASQQAYQIPNSIGERLADLYITVGTTVYTPRPIIDSQRWNDILASNLGESDSASYWYREGSKVLIEPVPATAGYAITFRGRTRQKDLSVADYDTGTIVSVASSGVAVIGDSTVWTASMAGRFIRITDSDTALKGDGMWYEILSVTDNTHLTLLKPYDGTAIAAGAAAYAIGQMSIIPEEYDLAPIYRATAIYYQKEDIATANNFWRMYDGGVEAGISGEYGGVIGRMLANASKDERHYIPPDETGIPDPNWPERELATGF